MTGMPRNRFKEKMSRNQTTYGLWLGIPDTSVAEMMAGAGFDWLVVDHEHGPYEIRDVLAHLQAIAPYDVAPVVRPVDGNRSLLKKLCDIGVQTFLVPMIDTAQEAIAVVEAVKYPPAGSRGLGTSMARAARWNSVSGYVGQADDEMCVIVQVESSRALQNIDAIATVDGIDAVFIGPSDLSASMGYGGDTSRAEELQRQIEDLQRIYSVGKYPSRFIKATKCALSLLGICDDFMAEPFHRFKAPEREKVRQIVGDLQGMGKRAPGGA